MFWFSLQGGRISETFKQNIEHYEQTLQNCGSDFNRIKIQLYIGAKLQILVNPTSFAKWNLETIVKTSNAESIPISAALNPNSHDNLGAAKRALDLSSPQLAQLGEVWTRWGEKKFCTILSDWVLLHFKWDGKFENINVNVWGSLLVSWL